VFIRRFNKRTNLSTVTRLVKFLSCTPLSGAIFIALALAAAPARAAELVMFEQTGCVWCAAFDREIAPVYSKTDEGKRAPLRRVDTDRALPPDLAFIQSERLTPLFVLVDKGHEIGRIRGYPGDDNFWGLLGVLIKKLDTPGPREEHSQLFRNSPRFGE
jgi:thioredoxin-related protein